MFRVLRFFTPNSRPQAASRSISVRNSSSSSHHHQSSNSTSVSKEAIRGNSSAHHSEDLHKLSKEELLKKFPKELDSKKLDKALEEGEQMRQKFSAY